MGTKTEIAEFWIAGKIDVGRYPDIAQKFHISTTSLTRQLPTVILFQEGKETGRVPAIISGKVQKFLFKDEDIINIFDLNNIYTECKKVNELGFKIGIYTALLIPYKIFPFS